MCTDRYPNTHILCVCVYFHNFTYTRFYEFCDKNLSGETNQFAYVKIQNKRSRYETKPTYTIKNYRFLRKKYAYILCGVRHVSFV